MGKIKGMMYAAKSDTLIHSSNKRHAFFLNKRKPIDFTSIGSYYLIGIYIIKVKACNIFIVAY